MSSKTSPTLERSAPPRWQLNPSRARQARNLFERYYDERDPVDREMLVERFLPLARQLASRYRMGILAAGVLSARSVTRAMALTSG